MAIRYARADPVRRSQLKTSLEASAYGMRTQHFDERLGEPTKRYVDDGTLAHHEILLPAGADPKFLDAATLWNAVEKAEKRIDAQVGLRVVTPLPRELTREENIDLGRSFAVERWVSKGRGVQIDFHDVPGNPHMHHLVTPRTIEGSWFSRLKAPIDEAFIKINGRPIVALKTAYGKIWAEFQERFFKLHGKAITVDPIAPIPETHVGPNSYPAHPRIAENARRQEINTQIAREGAAEYLASQGRFDEMTLAKFLSKHISDPVERLKIQARDAAKLAMLDAAARFKQSYADKTDSQSPMMIEDAARRINPDLDKALWEIKRLQERAPIVEKVLRDAQGWIGAGESRIKQREARMSPARKAIQKTLSAVDALMDGPKLTKSTGRRAPGPGPLVQRFGDPELDQGRVQRERAQSTSRKWKLEQKRVQDRLKTLQDFVTELLNQKEHENGPTLRERAQQDLYRRRLAAKNARHALNVIEKADTVLKPKRERRRSITP